MRVVCDAGSMVQNPIIKNSAEHGDQENGGKDMYRLGQIKWQVVTSKNNQDSVKGSYIICSILSAPNQGLADDVLFNTGINY